MNSQDLSKFQKLNSSDQKTGLNFFSVIKVPSENQTYSCQPYNTKGIYKISIHHGHNRIYYADKMLEFKEYAILFSRPNMVYRFEQIGEQYDGYLCVFSNDFFDNFTNINKYPLFKPEISPLLELTKIQLESFRKIFEEMEHEMKKDFCYRDDMLKTRVMQIILNAVKLQPDIPLQQRESNSAVRISSCFTELLEGQFPILNTASRMILRHPFEFAEALSVHVNHLNKSLKQITDKTTTQLIADRITKEAKILLQDTEWNVLEISWSLGFEDLSNFIKFFKKNTKVTPNGFRKSLNM